MPPEPTPSFDPTTRLPAGSDATPSAAASRPDDAGDADWQIESALGHAAASAPDTPLPPESQDWANELSSHRIAVELKRIETEVRQVLEGRDPKRKRRFSGTRRWLELEEDILAWEFTGGFDEPTLRRMQQLIAKRHHLFKRLHFLAGTRPTWNT